MRDVPELFEQSLALSQSGDYAGAARALKQIMEIDPAGFEDAAQSYVRSVSSAHRELFWTSPPDLYPDRADIKGVFQFIYDRGVWSGGSGPGSDFAATVPYVAYVQMLLERHAIDSVLDLGCGDWRFSRHLDFTGRTYLGYDVVPSVIAADTAAYGTSSIRFEHVDLTSPEPFPSSDLILCKDVLQHLSNDNVNRVLDKCRDARVVLITNDYHPDNLDCRNGDTRPLDVSAPPFNFPARPVLRFGHKVSYLAVFQPGQ